MTALWRRTRWYLLGGVCLLLVGLLIGGLSRTSQWPPLDPRSPDPDGTRAVVHLLEKQGITVRVTGDLQELGGALGRPGTTVVLPDADLLGTGRLDSLAAVRRANTTRLVLLAPQGDALTALAPSIGLATEPEGPPMVAKTLATPPLCPLPEAIRAGTAELGGQLYRPAGDDLACYPRHGRPSLIRHSDGSGTETVVLGTGEPLSNQRLTTEGNASLALGLLGAHPQLVWYLPDYSTPAPELQQKSFMDYIPGGWYWATLQLAIAAVLAALWRGRRLGPVVSEQLPVVVRAAETTEGRARLYRRANARGRAAEALRRAARHRLGGVLGVPFTAGEPEPTALCAAIAERRGRPSAEVHTLLYGAAPTDDAALLRLSDDLDALERQVRQP